MFRRRKNEHDMSRSLPEFRYHPDPVGTGSVVASESACVSCRRSNGWVYAGPVYATVELDDQLCPWCIGDGSAASRFDATFTDDSNAPPGVPREVAKEVAERTPGFLGWQQEHWLYHCDDACAYLGRIGAGDLEQRRDARQALRQECRELGMTEEETTEYLRRLHPDGDATGYLFKCLHCGMHSAYSDAN